MTRLVLCAALLVPALAAAQDAPEAESDGVSVTVTDDFELRYWVSPDRLPGFEDRAVFNYFEQVNRLNLSVGSGSWTFLAQVDEVVLTANRYVLDGEQYWERDLLSPEVYWPFGPSWYVNPEKLGARYAGDEVTVKLGDYYAAFGTGLGLNLNRNVDIDIDTSIQGAHMLLRKGAWDFTVLVGQANKQQVAMDNPNLGITGDRRHTIAGVRLERFGLGPANLGVHASMFDFVGDTGLGPGFSELGTAPDVVITGATAELLGVAGIDWTLEGDLFSFPTRVAWGGNDPSPGYALYGSGVWYLGATTWQLEGKRYLNAERANTPVASEAYEVVVGPTLEYERAITEDSAAAVNSNDIWGGRLRVDWTAVPGEAIPYLSVAVFRDLDLAGVHFNDRPETVLHPLLGIEVFAEDFTLLLNAGYRHDARDGGGFTGDADRQVHGDVDFKVPLIGHLHLDVAGAWEWFRWGDNSLQQSDYTEIESALSLLYGGDVAITLFTDYTDNPLVDTKGNFSDDLYGAVELQYKPTTALTLKAFGGAYKAGIRCSGGQCRLLPGFEGVKVSAVGTF